MQLNIIIVLCMITIMESTWFGIYCDRAFQFSLRGRGKTHKLFTPKSEGLLISFTEMDLKKKKIEIQISCFHASGWDLSIEKQKTNEIIFVSFSFEILKEKYSFNMLVTFCHNNRAYTRHKIFFCGSVL